MCVCVCVIKRFRRLSGSEWKFTFSHIRTDSVISNNCFSVLPAYWPGFPGWCTMFLRLHAEVPWISIVFNDEIIGGERRIKIEPASPLDTFVQWRDAWSWKTTEKQLEKTSMLKILKKNAGKVLQLIYSEVFHFRKLSSCPLPASCFRRRLQSSDLHFVDPPQVSLDPPQVSLDPPQVSQFSKRFFGKNPRCSMPNS